jgi:site-specific DNA-cytosine methylase
VKEASNHNNLSGRLLCLKVFIPLSLILFGWSWLDIWYYGVRYKQGCHPYDLWATYFTSSDYVAIQRWLYGEPDVIEVRRTFQTQKEARDWEIKVLRRMKVIKSERWLNKTDVKSIAPQYGNQNAKNGKGKRRKKGHLEKGNGFGYSMFNEKSEYTSTISARYYKDGSEILIEQKNKNPRKLTPREAARLQGFPEDFVIPVSDAQAYKQFGNSVAVPVIRELARRVVKEMEQMKQKKISYQKITLMSFLILF